MTPCSQWPVAWVLGLCCRGAVLTVDWADFFQRNPHATCGKEGLTVKQPAGYRSCYVLDQGRLCTHRCPLYALRFLPVLSPIILSVAPHLSAGPLGWATTSTALWQMALQAIFCRAFTKDVISLTPINFSLSFWPFAWAYGHFDVAVCFLSYWL